ncbi:Uncharacterised protein [Candidatus Burarchaeum australiense]|nr:Uncharacterised protein [Candidatus Burarchaeum australiense]
MDRNHHGCGGTAPGLNELVAESRKKNGQDTYEPSAEQKTQMKAMREEAQRRAPNTGMGVW